MSQDLKKSQRKGRELLALVVVELVDLLANERVGGQEHSQTTVFMPPLFQFREVLERACSDREVADVEVLERDEERVQPIHHIGVRSDRNLVVGLNNS